MIRSDLTSIAEPRIDSSELVMTIAGEAMTIRERVTGIGERFAFAPEPPTTRGGRGRSTEGDAMVIRSEGISIGSSAIDL